MKITAKEIKKLRELTGAGIMAVKSALEEAKGDEKKAQKILKEKGLEKLKQRSENEINEGLVFAYVHQGGRVGAMVGVKCETDFVAMSDDFNCFCKEIAMQVVSMEPKSVEDLLKQKYIRDGSKTIQDLLDELATKVKEKIEVFQIVRLSL